MEWDKQIIMEEPIVREYSTCKNREYIIQIFIIKGCTWYQRLQQRKIEQVR